VGEERIRVVCGQCGSDDVLADAYAEWDVGAQAWVVANVFDKGSFCNQCEGESRLREVVISEERAGAQQR